MDGGGPVARVTHFRGAGQGGGGSDGQMGRLLGLSTLRLTKPLYFTLHRSGIIQTSIVMNWGEQTWCKKV